MIRHLEVQIGKVVHSLCELVIHAFFLSGASGARSLDADSALDCSADAISVQVDPCTKVSHLLEQFNGRCVFLGVQTNILEEILKAITAEVMFFAFAEYRSQRLIDDVIVHKHLGQVGDFTLHQCLLKLDARGGDGNGQVLTVGHSVIMLGDNGCHQIRKGFTSSDLRFTEGDLLFSKADKHFL